MATHAADLLGGERVLGPLRSNLDLARATRAGLPAEAAFILSELLHNRDLPFPIAASLYTPDESNPRLTPEQSDSLVRVATALARAIDVLGDNVRAVHWMVTRNHALGGETPFHLLDTSAGAHEVEGLLDRIEYGVYS